MVAAVRANQWVAGGERATESELDEAVGKVFEYRAYSIVDLYHNIQSHERILKTIEFDDSAQEMIERSRRPSEGAVVVIPHVSNYELAGLATGISGGRGIALTEPEQPGGYQHHDRIRKQFGIEAIPASMSSFKYATKVLREGGIVATGIDRPLAASGYKPTFFGHPAALPVHSVVLALKAKVPIVVGCVNRKANGNYGVSATGLIPMKQYENRKSTILANAERILEICEQYISQDPLQWAMFFPVWPDVVPEPKSE